MKVLFLGTTGTHKVEVMRRLRETALQSRDPSLDPQDIVAESVILGLSLEDLMLESQNWTTLEPFFGKLLDRRRRLWREVFETQVLQQIENKNPQHVLLSLHGTFFRRNEFFSCLDLRLLREFDADVVITLIEDSYDIAARVAQRDEEWDTQSRVTVSDAMSWRSAEILLGDLVSAELGTKHFVFAVKHPIRTLYHLLFRRDLPIIYGSFPISMHRTVDGAPGMPEAELGCFRELFTETSTLLDPVRIDELLVKEDGTLNRRWNSTVCLQDCTSAQTQEPDVPTRDSEVLAPMIPGESDRPEGFREELGDLREVIKDHIRQRDYRLVDLSKFVIAYRPYWGGRDVPSDGVQKEVLHASRRDRLTFVFFPDQDGELDPEMAGPFEWLRQEMVYVRNSLGQIANEIQARWEQIGHQNTDQYGWATW